MFLTFPEDFLWGTATSAAQVETAYDHQWKDLEAQDGFKLCRTTDHEERRGEDTEYIRRLGNLYRCSVDWSRLQHGPLEPFDEAACAEYRDFLEALSQSGIRIMLVFHHFAHPRWFEQAGGWTTEDNIDAFVDFARRCREAFGPFVYAWNTINEPELYAHHAYVTGSFPPHQRGKTRRARRVIRHMAMAHRIIYDLFKIYAPEQMVGLALNVQEFHRLKSPRQMLRRLFSPKNTGPAAEYFDPIDFLGLSNFSIESLPAPRKKNRNKNQSVNKTPPPDSSNDKGARELEKALHRYYKRFKKPIIITASGLYTDDPQERIQYIEHNLRAIHRAMEAGVEVKGYVHQSTWDNFEWHLGPSQRSGLVRVNVFTKQREMTPAGKYYARIVEDNGVMV